MARWPVTLRPSATAVTVAPSLMIRRTGWLRTTRSPRRSASWIGTSCEPPTKRRSCAPPPVLTSRSMLPGLDSLPAAAR